MINYHTYNPKMFAQSNQRPLQRKGFLRCNARETQYAVVTSVISQELEWQVTVKNDFARCHLIWSDKPLSIDILRRLEPYQKVNHFLGMEALCRKDCLAWNLAKMQRVCPEDYSFFPKTWVLSGDCPKFKPNCKYIFKPQASSQGRGISLLQLPLKVPIPKSGVIQEYIANPLLLSGFKFDLRVYALLTSVNPLRIYIHKGGLARFATEPYADADHTKLFAHLTNYAINKHHPQYSANGSHKRSIENLVAELERLGYDKDSIYSQIDAIVVKSVSAVVPGLQQHYKSCYTGKDQCFQLLGFDILFDQHLKAWLLEVNRSPSLHTASPLDWTIKSRLIADTVRLVTAKNPETSLGQFRVPQCAADPFLKEARCVWLSLTGKPKRRSRFSVANSTYDFCPELFKKAAQPSRLRVLRLNPAAQFAVARPRCQGILNMTISASLPLKQIQPALESYVGPKAYKRKIKPL